MATRAPAEDMQQNNLQQNLPRALDKDQRGYLPGRKAPKREYIRYSPWWDQAFPYIVPQPIYHFDHWIFCVPGICLTAYRDKLATKKFDAWKTFKPWFWVTVSPLYFKFAFGGEKKEEKKRVGYHSIRANQLELSELSAQHPAWSWSQERRQKWPLWKYKFHWFISSLNWEFEEKPNSRFDVYLGRKNLAE